MLLARIAASTVQDTAEYSEFAESCEEWGYTWEAFKVITEDGWELTLFRITGTDEELFEQSEKAPILFQHGEFQDAERQLKVNSFIGKPWLLGLADRGYDVWLGNNRGTKYSNVTLTDQDATYGDKERWAFT